MDLQHTDTTLFSERSTTSSPPTDSSYTLNVVEVLFWPRTFNNQSVDTCTAGIVRDDVRTSNSAQQQQQQQQQQPFRIGFVVGWKSDGYLYAESVDEISTGGIHQNYGGSDSTGSSRNIVYENVIVAGVVPLPINNDSNSNKNADNSFINTLQQNRQSVQTMYHTIRSNIEYLGNVEPPKSLQCLFQDLSILGFFVDCSGTCSTDIDETGNEEIFNWLSSTIDAGSVIGCDNTTPISSSSSSSSSNIDEKLFVILQHNDSNVSSPKIVVRRARDAATKSVITKQVVYYDSNKDSTKIWYDPRRILDLAKIQVLWNHSDDIPFSITSHDCKIGSTPPPQQQPWLMRLTHAAFITQLIIDSDSNERIPQLAVGGRSHDDSIKSNVPLLRRNFLFHYSLFVRHCYCNYYYYTNTDTHHQSVFPIVTLLRQVRSRRQPTQVDRPLSPLLPIKPYNQIVHEYIVELNQLVQLFIDTVFGIFIGTILLHFGWMHLRTKSDDVSQSSYIVTIALNLIRQHYDLLYTYIKYLEDFPLGFKLNQDLLYNIGCEIQRSWKVHESVLFDVIVPQYQSLSSLQQTIPIFIMSLFAYAFGASGCMAFLFDIIHFGTLHISIFAWFTIRIYYYELYLLSTFWKLFRGKKCNILRNHRTDSMEYDSMQLLVGTIFFAIVLFLFTTIFVGHVFYSTLYFITVMAALPILLLYTSLNSFPWGILWSRRIRPGWFTRQIYLTEVDTPDDMTDSASSIDVTKLCYRPCTYHDIMSDTIHPRLQDSTRWIIQAVLLSLIGAPSSWNDFLDGILPMPQIQ